MATRKSAADVTERAFAASAAASAAAAGAHGVAYPRARTRWRARRPSRACTRRRASRPLRTSTTSCSRARGRQARACARARARALALTYMQQRREAVPAQTSIAHRLHALRAARRGRKLDFLGYNCARVNEPTRPRGWMPSPRCSSARRSASACLNNRGRVVLALAVHGQSPRPAPRARRAEVK